MDGIELLRVHVSVFICINNELIRVSILLNVILLLEKMLSDKTSDNLYQIIVCASLTCTTGETDKFSPKLLGVCMLLR